MKAFRIGINMAGAVSAGAYTAGVLDFLMEALDEWYGAKERGDAVPMHDVSIDVFSGASAGGMCAAIAAVQAQEDFEHIRDTSKTGTTNRLYESWVNRIDIRELLKIQDLKSGEPVSSLLDSTIIKSIADYALTPGTLKPRSYISRNLTLFLTLTNLRGVPYSLKNVGSESLESAEAASFEETTSYYGDRLRFETVLNGATTSAKSAKPLPLNDSSQAAWPLLRSAAMATGAFPIFLAPRALERTVDDYCPPQWQPVYPIPNEPGIWPDWPYKQSTGATWETLNVDGGVIDNDPFDLAHDYLASLDPATGGVNPQEPLAADRAVITVAPFPAQDPYDAQFESAKCASVFSIATRLFSALISQSRFFGESLAMIMTGKVFSRFEIAPSDTALSHNVPALQCASLSAFGGFFERGFRAHDYALGRRNCQQFLRCQFILPEKNPIIEAGLNALGERRNSVVEAFGVDPPNPKVTPQDQRWIPLIPLCGTAAQQVPKPTRAQISDADLCDVVGLISQRFKAVFALLIADVPSRPVRLSLKTAATLVPLFGKGKLESYLRAQLAASVGGTRSQPAPPK